jgi:hypothetical protein
MIKRDSSIIQLELTWSNVVEGREIRMDNYLRLIQLHNSKHFVGIIIIIIVIKISAMKEEE